MTAIEEDGNSKPDHRGGIPSTDRAVLFYTVNFPSQLNMIADSTQARLEIVFNNAYHYFYSLVCDLRL